MMTKRGELLKMFVLDAVCEDFEDMERILFHLEDLSRRCMMQFAPSEVVDALVSLIEEELVKAYKLSPTEPRKEIEGVPNPSEVGDCYYWITKKGMTLQMMEYSGWPFDEAGQIRGAWRPPGE